MKTQKNKKNILRRIDDEFSQAFKKSELYDHYQKHEDELIIAIRNNYLNLYYNCDSIAKIKYKKTKKEFTCDISTYYLGRNKGDKDRCTKKPNEIIEYCEKIKENSNLRATDEKKAQSKLVIQNNKNKDSKWYCIDIEYVKQFENQKTKNDADFFGRFDIIALSKVQPHRLALIELKYGNKAIGGKSGIYKHISDFCRFIDKGFFESHLRCEITEIVRSLKALDVDVPFEIPNNTDILSPEFYVITLNNNPESEKASTPKQTMAAYLFEEKRWGCKRLSTGVCVEDDCGDVTKKDNKISVTFLFSDQTLNNLTINDVIESEHYERINPT